MKAENKKAKKNSIRQSAGSRAFDIFNMIFLIGMGIVCLTPFLFVISASVSPLSDILTRKFFIYPKNIDLSTYKYLLSSATLVGSMGNSFLITIVGTALSMTVTLLMAYALSKPNLMGGKLFNVMIVFTMLFSGGMIPNYLIVSKLNLIDSFWALWLPGCVSAYNMIIIRTSMKALPKELEEAATVDGCNQFQCFIKIILPLIKPTIATFALFHGVDYWNSYFGATLYLNDNGKWPIQVWLRQIVLLSSGGFADTSSVSDLGYIPPQNVSYAVIVFATIPILLIYPFVQKFFTKGMMVGSVKG